MLNNIYKKINNKKNKKNFFLINILFIYYIIFIYIYHYLLLYYYYYYYHRVVLFFFFVLLLLSSIFNFRKSVWFGEVADTPILPHFCTFASLRRVWAGLRPERCTLRASRGWLWCFPLLSLRRGCLQQMVFRRKFGSSAFFRSIVVATLIEVVFNGRLLSARHGGNQQFNPRLPNTILKTLWRFRQQMLL